MFCEQRTMETAKINIQVNFQQILEAVKQLSPKEKLKLNDAIWEDDIDIPIEHQLLVLDRYEKGLKEPSRLLDWDEVSKDL
jgi:hypothetical protein